MKRFTLLPGSKVPLWRPEVTAVAIKAHSLWCVVPMRVIDRAR